MSNNITIELCAEDRARLDNLAYSMEALASLLNQDKPTDNSPTTAPDPVTEELRAVVEQAKNALGATEAQTHAIPPQAEEKPTEAKETEPAPKKTVSRTELAAQVRKLMTTGYREQTKTIVKEYAPTVTGVPEDKVAECYERLVALENSI